MRTGPKALLAGLLATALLAGSAQAASVSLRCAGRGARNRDSANTVLCASTTKGRTLAGTVKDDAGRPVAARLTVAYSDWIPSSGGGFSIELRETKTIQAKADGSFSFKTNPATRESIRLDVVADAALGVSGGAFATSEVARELKVSVAKLGGGKLRFTVTGTTKRPLKFWVLDSSGYPLPGVRPKQVPKSGVVSFDVGSVRGRLAYYVDAGRVDDLFWYHSRVPFRL